MGRRGVMRTDPGGWVLLEILAAVAVLAIVVGPLVAGVIGILGRGTGTELQADRLSSSDVEDVGVWTWGDRTLEAAWSPGPVLLVRIAAADVVSDAVVGVWAEGWQVAEVHPTESGRVTLGGSMWVDRVDQELVLRAREADGPWGPPWRTLVPDITGTTPEWAGGGSIGSVGGEVVVHSAVAANPRFDMEERAGEIAPGPSGSPFFAALIPLGPAGVRLDAVVGQSWLSEPDRGLDVYF